MLWCWLGSLLSSQMWSPNHVVLLVPYQDVSRHSRGSQQQTLVTVKICAKRNAPPRSGSLLWDWIQKTPVSPSSNRKRKALVPSSPPSESSTSETPGHATCLGSDSKSQKTEESLSLSLLDSSPHSIRGTNEKSVCCP